jgi:hypothetical protein
MKLVQLGTLVINERIFYLNRRMSFFNMKEKRNAYRILMGKPEGKEPLGKSTGRWEGDKEVRMEVVKVMNWVDSVQDRDTCAILL